MTTLAKLLGTTNRAEVARRLTAAGVPVSRDRVNRWAQDLVSPDAHEIVALAPVLRLEVDQLTEIVAEDIHRRSHGGPRSVAV